MLRTLTKVLSTMGRNHRAEDVAKASHEVGDLAEAPLEPEGVAPSYLHTHTHYVCVCTFLYVLRVEFRGQGQGWGPFSPFCAQYHIQHEECAALHYTVLHYTAGCVLFVTCCLLHMLYTCYGWNAHYNNNTPATD